MNEELFFVLLNKIKNLSHARFEKIDSLPLEGQQNIIYLVKNNDHFDEYIWLDTSEYEMIGTTDIDLSQYATIEQLYNLEVNKCERIRLTCDDLHIYRDDEILTFVEVLALIQNKRYYITMTYDNTVSFRPSVYDGDAIWFDSTYILDDVPRILRFIINKQNECKIDELMVAQTYDIVNLRSSISKETSARTTQNIQLLNAINAESERAQGVEEILSTHINDEVSRAIDVENSLVQSIGHVQENLESEIDALDICIDEKLWGNGESGYRKYRNGFLIQWGVTTSNAGGEQDFTLHTPYNNQLFSIFITPREMGNFFYYGYPRANNKFACRIQSRDSQSMAVRFSWLSIGRWK